ncbi:hypothetical protein L1987_08934 [Smallanthus sonchifolius]|uniref:Uncharacterized protein n=1 Tax=Smallanthus sonchifolius TaxID=185202 RepID=A0ACB9JN48_9ASTR|nr:hypothetical protein L1987_08934 [Smallanthus sonchifolius]
MSFICGSGIQEEDNFEDLCMLPSTPQRKITRRRHSFGSRSNKDSKNPYSNRGLDKFEALLADLDGKRQKIYTQKGSEDISLVRFVYTNSNDVRPIVVKMKDQRKQEKDQKHKLEDTNSKTSGLGSSPEHPIVVKGDHTVVQLAKPPIVSKKSVGFDQLVRKLGDWWRPWYSLPLFVILILVFLVFFGRSFAILCTSIGWYLVPAINSRWSENPKGLKKTMKKEYSRKSSEKMIMSPRSVLSSAAMNPQPHRRSF